MRSIRHLTPHYIWSRILWKTYHRRFPFAPYLNAKITQELNRIIGPESQGLETGSGSSTIWFAERCGHLTSIEHDAIWAKRVTDWLADRDLSEKVAVKLCERGPDGTPQSYVDTIMNLPEASLDFILIDGKKRDSCALAALPRIKAGGIIIVDDVHRYIARKKPSHAPFARDIPRGNASSKWDEFTEITRNWPCIWKSDGVSDTAVWTKPNDLVSR
jgi:predicted O-methyltransferase YrrM